MTLTANTNNLYRVVCFQVFLSNSNNLDLITFSDNFNLITVFVFMQFYKYKIIYSHIVSRIFIDYK